MTSDVKLSHCFLLKKVYCIKQRRVGNTQIIQKIISKHRYLCEYFYGWVHITENYFYFNLNVLKLELHYQWNHQKKCFYRYRVLGSWKKSPRNPPGSNPDPIRNLTLTLPLIPHRGLFSIGIFSWHPCFATIFAQCRGSPRISK